MPLPVCTFPCKLPYYFDKSEYTTQNISDYQDLIQIMSNVVGGYCCALYVNDEQLYDTYDDSKSFHELMTLESIRAKIAKDSHSLFCHINRLSKPVQIKIYDNKYNDYKTMVLIEYNPTEKKYTVSAFSNKEVNEEDTDEESDTDNTSKTSSKKSKSECECCDNENEYCDECGEECDGVHGVHGVHNQEAEEDKELKVLLSDKKRLAKLLKRLKDIGYTADTM